MLKLAGIADPYTLLKEYTRGRKISRQMLMDLVDSLDIPDALRVQIHALNPIDYVGDAVRICDAVIKRAANLIYQ